MDTQEIAEKIQIKKQEEQEIMEQMSTIKSENRAKLENFKRQEQKFNALKEEYLARKKEILVTKRMIKEKKQREKYRIEEVEKQKANTEGRDMVALMNDLNIHLNYALDPFVIQEKALFPYEE